MSSDSLLLAHLFAQTQANISFFTAHNYLSASDASDINTRLAAAQANALSLGARSVSSDPHSAAGNSGLKVPKAGKAPKTEQAAKANKPPPPPRVQKAKALWAYNEDGSEPNDLSFSTGEIVEIVSETNPDWWTGKCRGRQGLFPSNHVEKMKADAPPAHTPSPTPSHHSIAAPSPWVPPGGGVAMPGFQMPSHDPHAGYDAHGHGGYQPPGHGYQPPPHDPHGYAPPYAPPYGGGPSAHSPYGDYKEHKEGKEYDEGKEHDEEKEHKGDKKKKKFGKLGGTMASAAAGGVGFGAGAAIGSGIIGAIF